MAAIQKILTPRQPPPTVRHTIAGAPRRITAERFIADIFHRHYGARVSSFAPNLMLLEDAGRIVAAAGWRCAGEDRLFLETYLDEPIETAVARLAGQPVKREAIVEVGNLAADRPGGSVDVILNLARHLDREVAGREIGHAMGEIGQGPRDLGHGDPEADGEGG